MNKSIAVWVTTWLLPAVLALPSAEGQQPGRSDLPKWVDEVQTYGMLPLLPQRAAELHVSVNGVWAGIGTDDPILPRSPQRACRPLEIRHRCGRLR